MKTTSRTTLLMVALGMLGGASGWMMAQETGAVAGSGQVATATVPAQNDAAVDNGALPGDSHVRIVRLSDVKGALALDRQTGHGFEATMQNMPIVQGERLKTGDGYAEVEFEDGSTLRLAPNSQVDFPLLALRSSGAKASTMSVVQGTVYVTTENAKGDEFLLELGAAKLMVAPATHLRLVDEGGKTVLSVFKGSVEVQRGEDTQVVDKKESLTLDASQMTVAKSFAEEPYDAWDKQSNDYHQRYATANAFAGGGNAFGLSDLNYYGGFINAGGCGQMWQPYMVSAAWNPYGNGVWALYPGAGYSWVSPYPWGWLPYHSGSWAFCQGVGWGWQPGGNFYGLNNIAGNGFASPTGGGLGTGTVTKSPVHSPLRPAAPQIVAGATKPSLVLANQTPLVFSKEDKPGNFVFQKDSAGLGVPRGSLGDLNKISANVERHGSASMPVYVAAPRGGMEGGREVSRGPATFQKGSAGEGQGVEHGGASAYSASRQAGSGGSQAGQASSSHGGGASSGGSAAPMSSPAGMSGGGSSAGASGSARGGSPK